MNGYEMLGKVVVYGIIYFLSSAILGLIITGDTINGADLDSFLACAWIGGCITCIVMIFNL